MPLSTLPNTLRFELRQSAGSGSHQHLALFAGPASAGAASLAHWLLSDELRRIELLAQVLLTEAPGNLLLPRRQLDGGTSRLWASSLPLARSLNHVQLTLRGIHLNGYYSLQRLRSGGTCWLFGPLRCSPERQRLHRSSPGAVPPPGGINRSSFCGYAQT